MDFKEFQEFIDKQDLFLQSAKTVSPNERERVLSRTVKISEEFGELCDEVLASMGDQRDSKLVSKKKDDLADEFADVVITVFLLAKSLNVNIPEALCRKIEKIREKHNKELRS